MKKVMIILISFMLTGQIVYAQASFKESNIWTSGEDKGIERYHVYGLTVTNDGAILAFAEGRIKPKDGDPHHIVLKRSMDLGETWSHSRIIVRSKNGECYANPTPVVDRRTGHIYLFYTLNSDVFYITSEDDGITWGSAERITSILTPDSVQQSFHYSVGPGHGICLQNGRLLVQVWHRLSRRLPKDQRKYGVSVIYSDDDGKHWNLGGTEPQSDSFPANESRLVELPSGEIMLESRCGIKINGAIKRILSFSKDKGMTWSKPSTSSIPSFTPVDAGLNKLTIQGKTYLLFSRPLGPGRKDLAISVSEDNGVTWPYTKLIHQGSAGYSDVVVLPDKSILVLYGSWPPVSVTAARFNLAWIKN